jgi:outer membrane biosynthesis protein TonB
LEAEQKETDRQVAAQQAAARQEAAQREAAQQAAARQEATRVEAKRLEAERQEAARLAAAQKESESREAARRAMGRKLDEEAAQREAAATATRQPDTRPSSWSTARRGRLFGRSDANAELVLYAEAWARKIQFNTPVDVVREVAKRARTDPLVTVAIRRDGSVESVTFVLSSGVTEIDEAIRRIVQSHAPYQAFSPALAREFDVIEIRRTWYFDATVRLY